MSDPIDPTTPRRKPKPEVTTIGGRALRPSTLMMGYGYDPVLSEGSLKPPSCRMPQTHVTTFAFTLGR